MAIHIHEPDFSQPCELSFEIQQLIRWIFRLNRKSDAVQKFLMQACRRRSDVLQIAKDSAGIEPIVDFAIEALLPLMHEVMNGKTRNHRVEFLQYW